MMSKGLIQLVLSRVRHFLREPEAVFWTYGFPLLAAIVLGLAFRSKPNEVIQFDVVESVASDTTLSAISDLKRFEITVHPEEIAMDRLRTNKTIVVVTGDEDGGILFNFDAANPEARQARMAIDDAIQRAAGRTDPVSSVDVTVTAPGSRYIDFLVPGLIGMNLMGGGLWGVGFTLVDMRVRNLLKRLLATPMRRSDFLLSLVGVRALFFIPEMAFLLGAAYLLFGVPIRGNPMTVVVIAFVGSVAFAGLGLLTACRAKRIETVSGLMNLIMLPMWLMSGIFFSSERFPDALQPFIQALPLTQLINALRAVILEGAGLMSQTVPMLVLLAWGGMSFVLALRWFRWTQ